MKIVSNEYRYSDGDVALTGFLVRPDDVLEQPAPAVLLVHGGEGLDHARTGLRVRRRGCPETRMRSALTPHGGCRAGVEPRLG
jgi:hypothetical protein